MLAHIYQFPSPPWAITLDYNATKK